ncbi:NTF2 and RRM domain-containing protein [Arthroderma uncinatum]|uniref:NTF2 and RRM domain-containing protein n=1 Tax=Arthroderma uncinatum TaxID=74035 RepID=UPI00144A563E|nr:NTF2 and RRM domain-containing protein [Arthroderma uncinatum]KAF3484000.1 NTF2 and RRM domain-containing protein [Arthroderma uncinatum]
MATETVPATNGTYHNHHQANPYPVDPYAASHQAANASAAQYAAQPANSSAHAPASSNDSKNDIPKDEVGWFFVEQYYTTLSRTPEKLHLFYSRKSQFVSGIEAEKINVAVGQRSIKERIEALDYNNCKVRVLNVDSQASFDNILVVVIGEMSNNLEAPRKFVQTFVLAEQQNGYYVLNDIIRYLNDEDEEMIAEDAPAVEEPAIEQAATNSAAPAPEAAIERQADSKAAAHEVDEMLEKEAVNGEIKPEHLKEQEPEAAAEEEQKEEVAEEEPAAAVVPVSSDAIQPEKPKGPDPSPANATPKAPTPALEKKATAGAEHGRRQPRQQTPTQAEGVLGYVKNVNEKVDASLLRQTLARFGKLKYFDVNRQRNCAFVEFNDPAAYKAAVAANPHTIGSEQITVEERRPRANAYGGNAGYAGRGGSGRGRGDRTGGQGRGGFQKDSGRYNNPSTRGSRGGSAAGSGNVTPKGRGQPQPV